MLSPGCLEYLTSKVAHKDYIEASPYPFLVIDEFFQPDIASAIAAEFPSYEAAFLDGYSNAIEEKSWSIIGINLGRKLMLLSPTCAVISSCN